MSGRAFVVAARRTPVAPRGGALKAFQADELAAPVLQQLLKDVKINAEAVDQVILGNALYGGGNPARLAALRAGLSASMPAISIDTQCCSGLDAIIMGARLIESGAADCVIAGGAESFSRAPIRMHRSKEVNGEPIPYGRPAFAPPPFSDPDLTEAAASLAERSSINRQAQAEFAVSSHAKAQQHRPDIEPWLVVPDQAHVSFDSFTRSLNLKTAMKAPIIAGSSDRGLSAATIACEADAAASVLLMSMERARALELSGLEVLAAQALGGDPADPALVPNDLAPGLLDRAGCTVSDLTAVELHEAYAIQAMVTQHALSFPEEILNLLGGGLARGHPIGASGAILVVQAMHAYRRMQRGNISDDFCAMALIAAAGGLASGAVLKAWSR